jgi:DNA-binding PadR family transcriptional regulator
MSPAADINSHLPLTETTFFILLSLSPGSRHGYAIMKEVKALSEGRVILSTGTLYGALKRLLEQRWIERKVEESGPANGRERKAYTLTRLGRQVLEAEVARLRRLVAAVQSRPATEGALVAGGSNASLATARDLRRVIDPQPDGQTTGAPKGQPQ